MLNKRSAWLRCAAVLAGATLAAGVYAADGGPRYTYGELGYLRTDIEDFSEDVESLGVGGSLALTDMFHLYAAYDDGELDTDFGPEIDVTTLEVGVGLNFPLSDTVDLVGEVGWVSAEIDASGFGGVDDDGFSLSGGLRAMLTPQFELNGGVSYVDIEDSDDTSLDVGAVYNFTELFAVVGGASFADDATTYGVGVRLYFDL